MKAKWTALIFSCIFMIASCKKDDSAELVVVKGKVWDDKLLQPVKNMSVIIYDVECENFMCHANDVVDSTKTDDNGNYEINYKRKNSNSLYVVCNYPRRLYVHPTDQGNEHQILNPGTYTGKDFILRKTSVLKARVVIRNNPFPPLKISDNKGSYIQINGASKDTIIQLRAVANSTNQLSLVANSPDMSYYRLRWDDVVLGAYADTFNITIEADPNTFPITKY